MHGLPTAGGPVGTSTAVGAVTGDPSTTGAGDPAVAEV